MKYVCTLEMSELSKLVYRDHVRLKHANRKRLAEEMQAKQTSEQLLLKDKPKDKVAKHPLSEMLAKYLLKAGNSGKGNSVTIRSMLSLIKLEFRFVPSDTSDMIYIHRFDIDKDCRFKCN